jgi:hypothetical protein
MQFKYTQAAYDAGLDKHVAEMRRDSDTFNNDMKEFDGPNDLTSDSHTHVSQFGPNDGATVIQQENIEPNPNASPGHAVPIDLRQAKIEISPDAKDVDRTIAHEARHAVNAKKELRKGNLPKVQPLKTFEQYEKSPREVDARAHADRVMRELKKKRQKQPAPKPAK